MMNELQWIEDIIPVPEELYNIPNLEKGRYKLWIGDVDPHRVVDILERMEDILRNTGYEGNTMFNIYIEAVLEGSMGIDSLYLTLYPNDLTRISYMGWNGSNRKIYDMEHSKEYYLNATDKPI